MAGTRAPLTKIDIKQQDGDAPLRSAPKDGDEKMGKEEARWGRSAPKDEVEENPKLLVLGARDRGERWQALSKRRAEGSIHGSKQNGDGTTN